MEYDIFITEREGGREMQIPWLPDKISFKPNGARFVTYDILDLGEVKQVSGKKIGGFSWKCFLPGSAHSDLPFLRGTWRPPDWYQGIWSQWRVKGTHLRLLIPNTPINHNVLLADYTADYSGAYGDYEYSIEFCDDRDIAITSRTETKPAVPAQTRPAAPTPKTYTIKDGDTLWGIAQRDYKNGLQWPKIYNANKKVLDDEAERRGYGRTGDHWIFSGTTITIPA